ncbi:MAG: ribulose-phosphate 3-epimerase [Patescibacteria group bacterium]
MIEVIPSILAKNAQDFSALVLKIAPFVSRAVIDIGDGEFVPDKIVGEPEELLKLHTTTRFDVHLMVADPIAWLNRPWPEQADRFFAHIEALGARAEEFITLAHSQNRKAGLVLNPETPIETIEPFIGKIDFVQFMTVHPGGYGAEFLPEVLDNISSFHKLHPEVSIAVDGGINPETAPLAIKAGAQILVVGSYVMMSEDPEGSLRKLQNSIMLS